MALTSTIWWSCSTVWSNVTFQTVSVGGEEAVVNEFPWAALLHLRSSETNQTSRCGGSLITDRHVLTAGHCLRESADNGEIDDVYDDITVVLGEIEIIILPNKYVFLFIYFDLWNYTAFTKFWVPESIALVLWDLDILNSLEALRKNKERLLS